MNRLKEALVNNFNMDKNATMEIGTYEKGHAFEKNKFYNFCDEDYNYIIYPEETTKDNKVTKIFMCKTEKNNSNIIKYRKMKLPKDMQELFLV